MNLPSEDQLEEIEALKAIFEEYFIGIRDGFINIANMYQTFIIARLKCIAQLCI